MFVLGRRMPFAACCILFFFACAFPSLSCFSSPGWNVGQSDGYWFPLFVGVWEQWAISHILNSAALLIWYLIRGRNSSVIAFHQSGVLKDCQVCWHWYCWSLKVEEKSNAEKMPYIWFSDSKVLNLLANIYYEMVVFSSNKNSQSMPFNLITFNQLFKHLNWALEWWALNITWFITYDITLDYLHCDKNARFNPRISIRSRH